MGRASVRRLALTFGASALLLVMALPVQAQVEAPVKLGGGGAVEAGELKKDPVGKVEDVVEDTSGEVEEVVEDTSQTVEETVAETKKTVEETVAELEDAAKEVIGGETSTKPGTNPQTGPTTDPRPGNTQRGEEKARNEGASRVESAFARRSEEGSTTMPPRLPDANLALARSVASESAAPSLAIPGITPGEALERLAFPMFMVVLVVAFLLLQGRFDRSDPKLFLGLDPDGERLSFE